MYTCIRASEWISPSLPLRAPVFVCVFVCSRALSLARPFILIFILFSRVERTDVPTCVPLRLNRSCLFYISLQVKCLRGTHERFQRCAKCHWGNSAVIMPHLPRRRSRVSFRKLHRHNNNLHMFLLWHWTVQPIFAKAPSLETENQQSCGDNSGCQCWEQSGVTPLTTDGGPTFFFFLNVFLSWALHHSATNSSESKYMPCEQRQMLPFLL